MFYLPVKKQILLTQLLLKVIQFGALWYFSTIHTPTEMGKWSYSFSVIAIATTILGLGNNISLKSNRIIDSDKSILISFSLILYLVFSPLLFLFINKNFSVEISVVIVIIGFYELYRIQYSIYAFHKQKLFFANLIENMPLILGIVFGILFQNIFQESFGTRIVGYAFGSGLLLSMIFKSSIIVNFGEIKESLKHVNWIKYLYLINVALLLSYDKLLLERLNTSFLGIYSVNFVIISSLNFVIKYVENLIVGSAISTRDLRIARIATIIMGGVLVFMLPYVFRILRMEEYILKGCIPYVLMFLPYALLELSIAQNRLYKSNDFQNYRLFIIFIPTVLLYSLSYTLYTAEVGIIIGYILNLFITVILINTQLKRSKERC